MDQSLSRHDLQNGTEEDPMHGIPTQAQQRYQGARCGCQGTDDMCPCQNTVWTQPTVDHHAEKLKKRIAICANQGLRPSLTKSDVILLDLLLRNAQ